MTELDKHKVIDEYLGMAFFNGSDRSRFGSLLDRLQNDYLQGHNGYPRTLTMAYHLLTNWKPESTLVDNSHAAVFITIQCNSTRCKHQNNPTSHNNVITCYNCGLTGHYANNCPRSKENNNTPNGQNVIPMPALHQDSTNESNVLITSASLSTCTNPEFTFHIQHSINNHTTEHARKSSNHIPMEWILLDKSINNQRIYHFFSTEKFTKFIYIYENTLYWWYHLHKLDRRPTWTRRSLVSPTQNCKHSILIKPNQKRI
jgi:hypothetical protein